MAINRIEIKDFLVFKGEFALDFCPGVNVLIGGNGTGETTLLKYLYESKKVVMKFESKHSYAVATFEDNTLIIKEESNAYIESNKGGNVISESKIANLIYIPEKDILEHAKGLLPFIDQKPTGFSRIYRDVIVSAQDIPTKNQSETQKKIGETITGIIGGYIEWVQSEGSFYTVRTDGVRIPFSSEASGFKKLGFLGLLVASGQLEPGAVLFWDEPENSLNPELVPILVDVLLELSRNGVQIFLATHSEILASYFSVNREKCDVVMFYSLYKDGEHIKADKSDRFDLLVPNNLTLEPVRLYERKPERGLGGNG